MNKRFASIYLPHLAIERYRRANRRLRQPEQRIKQAHRQKKKPQEPVAPLALIDKTMRGIRLSALDENARQQGLLIGMALSDALVLCPRLVTRKASPLKDRQALLALARWCERYGPAGNLYDEGSSPPDSLWVDVTGVAHLFDDEATLLTKIRNDFQNQGYTAFVGLADTFAAAFALSHHVCDARTGTCLSPADALQDDMAPLSIEALRLAPEICSLLHRLGLVTIKQLMDLPRSVLKRRFPSTEQANAVLLRLDQLLGLCDEPLSPLSQPPLFSSRLHFADALLSKQMLEQALIHLLAELILQLETQNQGVRHLVLILWRSDGSRAQVRIGTSSPNRDKVHIFNLLKEKLDHIEPGSGVDIIALIVERSAPLSPTQISLSPSSQDTKNTPNSSVLIDRLVNHLGAQKISYLQAIESHIPERAQQLCPHKPATTSWSLLSDHAPSRISPRPFLLLDPPEPISVMAPLPDEPPLLFTWRRVTRKVVLSDGPERITPEWWRELGHTKSRPRDYYRVSTDQDGSFWLYRDGLYEGEEQAISSPRWFMHGFFD